MISVCITFKTDSYSCTSHDISLYNFQDEQLLLHKPCYKNVQLSIRRVTPAQAMISVCTTFKTDSYSCTSHDISLYNFQDEQLLLHKPCYKNVQLSIRTVTPAQAMISVCITLKTDSYFCTSHDISLHNFQDGQLLLHKP